MGLYLNVTPISFSLIFLYSVIVPVSLMGFKLALLKSKGFMMNNLPTTKADFLKYESAAYDNWYGE